MAIKPLLMSAFEKALNTFINLDQNSAIYLEPLNGKLIAITLQPFNETFYLCPTANSIQLLDYSTDTVDTTLTGSVLAFSLMGLSSKPMRSIFSGQVKIEGDSHTGRKFQELFAKLDLNLEQLLAPYTGDSIAYSITQFLSAGRSWSNESIETFRLNCSEFLQEETRQLPPAPELDIFFAQVDDLRTDSDRLQSRIERLEKIINIGNS
ncbi:MAG: SCP2 sterol-binding domain-containing protein [Methylococcales bacterium]